MCVSQYNNRLFLAILLGMFITSGCSGHSVKYGANSEGEEMVASEEEMSASEQNAPIGSVRNADGTMVHGGIVDGNNAALRASQGASQASPNSRDMQSDKTAMNGNSFIPGGADSGQQFNGVDGSGPNYDSVTGFGSGAADPNNPDPEAWAKAYLQEGKSQQDFYGDPSTSASSSHNRMGETADYGNNSPGVSGIGPNYGGVEGFSQGSASSMEITPEAWAQAYLKEKGGPLPEYVNPDMNIAQSKGSNNSHSMGMNESMGMRGASGDLIPMGNTNGGFQGRVQDIYFAFDSWSISAEGARYLEEDAQWLHANPEKALMIEGHCDQRGTQDYNLVLGKKRAEAAREYLVNLGIQSYRIKIVSYGKERPFCQKNNEDCFQKNRRNHMVVQLNPS
jgi:peptidoglycan-associated lipoprotein